MTYSYPTTPQLQPVPAVPITVLSHTKGACRIRVAGTMATGVTLRSAVEAAITSLAQKDQT